MFLPSLAFAGAHIIGRIADQGTANTLGLKTLRHGTNPLSWISIHLLGALPQAGGSTVGGDYGSGCHAQNLGRFYFARGPVNLLPNRFKPWHERQLERISAWTSARGIQRLLPKTYAMTSTTNLLNRVLPALPAKFLGYSIGALIPTIKFRYPEQTVEIFYEDHTIPNRAACSTDKWQSPLNIGVIGTVWQSLTYRTPIRMFQHPVRVLTGIAQLGVAGAAIYLAAQTFPAILVAQKTAILAGFILGVI